MGTEADITQVMSIDEEEKALLFALKLAGAPVLPMVLKTALDLDLFDILAKAGSGAYLSAYEIASQLPVRDADAPAKLDRLLRLLVTHSVLVCSLGKSGPNGGTGLVYSLPAVSKFLAKNEDGVSLAPLCNLVDKDLLDSWYCMKDAVLDGGIPFDKAHGITFFEYMGKNPTLGNAFNKSMMSYSVLTLKKILKLYNGFDGITTLVDVGGGVGASLNIIISVHPTIQGINYDLPYVIQNAPSYPGIKHVDGDMFVSVPKGDAIYLQRVLHDWSDEQCIQILKNCYDSIPENGKVLVIEMLIPDVVEANTSSQISVQMDLFMLAYLPGKERTAKEFEALAKAAGFSRVCKACCAANLWVMEFHK